MEDRYEIEELRKLIYETMIDIDNEEDKERKKRKKEWLFRNIKNSQKDLVKMVYGGLNELNNKIDKYKKDYAGELEYRELDFIDDLKEELYKIKDSFDMLNAARNYKREELIIEQLRSFILINFKILNGGST